MDKKSFNKITKEVFLEYGFTKKNQKYFLILQDVSLVVYFASWRGVKSFNYYFSINELYDSSIPVEQRSDTLVEIKMEHNQSAKGYHKHEILFEQYTADVRKGYANIRKGANVCSPYFAQSGVPMYTNLTM